MSLCRNMKSGPRRCAMLASDPVSKLSTQITRCPRASSSSHRCEPRKPAPPVTTHVLISPEGYPLDRKSTRLNSSHPSISYAVFCLKKKNKPSHHTPDRKHAVQPHTL